jgi:hypothetical protein
MNTIKKYIFYASASLIFSNTLARGTYTAVESGVTLYSEYYYNPQSKFKGTIIF